VYSHNHIGNNAVNIEDIEDLDDNYDIGSTKNIFPKSYRI